MINILFTGDVVIQNKKCSIDSIWNEEIQSKINKYQYKCCNFEGSFETKDASKIKKIGPAIKIAENSVDLLKKSGFNIITLANNHSMDYGFAGLKKTKELFESCNVIGGGDYEEAYKPLILKDSKQTVGIMNGAENGYGSCIKKGECGYAWFNSIVFYENLKRLRTEVDYLILVMHCGIEKIDLPIPEWRDYFKGLIDFFGVDAIIAHHPHVVQGYEKWHEGLIYYSLGNFIWDKQPLYSNETILVGLNIDKGKCIPEVIPVEIDDYKVKINNSIEFENKIDQLCKTLQSDSYESIVDNTLELIYEERYQPIFYDIIHMKNGKRNIIHNLYQIICQQKNLKDLSVFHNVGIESHQYCLRRISRKHLI